MYRFSAGGLVAVRVQRPLLMQSWKRTRKVRLAGLRSSVAVLAICALLAFIFATGIPTRRPGAAPPTGADEAWA